MNATNSNAGREASEAANAVLDERSDFPDDEIASRQAASLKQRFDRLNAEISPVSAPRKALRSSSRPSVKRRSSTRARPRRSSRTAAGRPRPANRAAHEARCTICCHPEREAIEEEFVHWLSPRTMKDFYGIESRAVYRHAHAFNLFAVRDRNLRFALGHIIDRSERIPCTHGTDVIRAVHAFARINDEGQWVEPPSQVIVSSGSRSAAPQSPQIDPIRLPALPPPTAENPLENPSSSLDTLGRTEHHAND